MGETPTSFLNTVEKYNGSEKPDSRATFFTESIPWSNKDIAYFILSERKYSEYPTPVFFLNSVEMYFALYPVCSATTASDKSGFEKFSSLNRTILFTASLIIASKVDSREKV